MSPTSSYPATTDVSIRNQTGEVVLFSWSDFVETICEGRACFICGRTRAEAAFNDEHIVPNWVLHAFDLHKLKITLPNGTPTLYGNYTIPCCERCNSEMSRALESDMSALVKAGPGAIQDHVAAHGGLLPYTWMALIFLKLHLNDRRMRMHLDRRKGDATISADYVWEHMHHVHAVARAFHIDADVELNAMGSMFVFPVDGGDCDFDLHTFTEAQTLYLQLGQTGMIAVFDDSHAATNRVRWVIERIMGAVSPVQARELAVHFAMANLDLENRPRFWTHVSADRNHVTIGGTTDAAAIFRRYDRGLFGHLMEGAFRTPPPILGKTTEEVMAGLAAGEISFLFDADGEFLHDHLQMSKPDETN
ncbi:hypothetical protein EB810_09815 [Altererythrobacter sp. FM1]|uniref:hypothetical protein n=1 Tax=Tsuneonella flava TaxID=2055955 RepID=UPI000C8045F2|nr:hypothetical protein [Tsuneonella flava]ROT95378.1 hypothetical protein EB810_09815 [Altererythrobacter sp. FM1]